MGGWMSRRNSDAEEQDVPAPTAFRYPPKSGNYFNTHFIMGGERFETPQPEQYLFGDNSDLNFLGSKPVPFPYPAPQSNEPTKTLKALINIRKETLKFVKIPIVPLAASDSADLSDEGSTPTPPVKPPTTYNIEFVFDADCRCEITIMYFCTEEVTSRGVRYRPRDPKLSAETIRFKAGTNQIYTNSLHTFTPSQFPDTDLQYDFEKEVFPIVIQCVSLDDGGDISQSHITTAIVDKYSDGSYSLKPMKQKLFVDGILYLLQEIYGIENKNASRKIDDDESDAENSAECVICMSDVRDTLILPCRHLCLCHSCADSLRYQANNCPICRSPFRALLQIRAVFRIPPAPMEYPALTSEMPVVQMNSIPGYEMVPLLEALNGPYPTSDLPSSTAATVVVRQEAARMLNPCEETNDGRPIAMTVMVAPSLEDQEQDDSEKGSQVVYEVERKESIVKLSKSGSIDTKTLTSDPEDEEHFSEAPESMPDVQDFTNSGSIGDGPGPHRTGSARFSSGHRSRITDVEEEEALQLQSIESSHSNMLTMIAAIDEFSDEEEEEEREQPPPTRKCVSASAASGLMAGTGKEKVFIDSTQSTPKRSIPKDADDKSTTDDSPSSSHRYNHTVPTSLPGTPNVRTSMSAGTNPTSLRSSGDSFTSSSSTKQLLPQNTTHQN